MSQKEIAKTEVNKPKPVSKKAEAEKTAKPVKGAKEAPVVKQGVKAPVVKATKTAKGEPTLKPVKAPTTKSTAPSEELKNLMESFRSDKKGIEVVHTDNRSVVFYRGVRVLKAMKNSLTACYPSQRKIDTARKYVNEIFKEMSEAIDSNPTLAEQHRGRSHNKSLPAGVSPKAEAARTPKKEAKKAEAPKAAKPVATAPKPVKPVKK